MKRAARLQDRGRRGNYAIVMVFAILILLGFGALAVDISYMRMAEAQTQDVADAASQAAIYMLRRTGSTEAATSAAQTITQHNRVAGEPPTLEDIKFGVWDDRVSPGVFQETFVNPNAVSLIVSRVDDHAVPLFLAPMWGLDEVHIRKSATSATRSLQAIIVLDITGSWRQRNFHFARAASSVFLQHLMDSHSEWDQIGMTIFTNRFSWEYTPLTFLEDDDGEIMADWQLLNVASKGGIDTNPYDDTECSQNTGDPYGVNDFTTPQTGGCYPSMPREYRDEPGTDHTTGMRLAQQMFVESNNPTAYRAMIVLTDGIPNGIGNPGASRAADGYEEQRWREYLGPAPHSGSEIRYDSIATTQEMWDDQRVHTWVVSFVADDWFMHDMPQGDGYYQLTSSAAALVPIFEDIANSMPLAIVE